MNVDKEELVIKFDHENVYPLKEILFEDQLITIRKKLNNSYAIVKIDGKLYTTISKICGKLDFKGKTSLCLSCSKFWDCPKVRDKEFLSLPFTMEKYDALMRIEKYPFIRFGLETYSFFYVWECTCYSPLHKENKPKKESEEEKQKALEKKYPILKELNEKSKEIVEPKRTKPNKSNQISQSKKQELESLIKLVS